MSYLSRIKQPDVRKGYSHFDNPVSYREVARLVENPEWVCKHAFYPLISTDLDCSKYAKTRETDLQKAFVPKYRHISYAAHIDHRIYQCYALRWYDEYQNELDARGLSCCIAAYRPGRRMSNITCAAKAINFIRDIGDCVVLTGDFKDFFPSIQHEIMLNAMRKLYPCGFIPEDSYRVLKSVLKYAEWPLDNLLKLRGFDTSTKSKRAKALRIINKERRPIIDTQTFRENKSKAISLPWRKDDGGAAGIPQGLAVSGVLSNIYMLDADTGVNRRATALGGFFSRYCDDFIVVIPGDSIRPLEDILRFLELYPGLLMSPTKTKLYRVAGDSVYRLRKGESISSHLSYLGFDFNGRDVTLRQKTIGRFYNRYYRNIRLLRDRKIRPTNAEIKAIYRRFSYKGAFMGRPFSSGNFLSYVRRAQRAFPDDPISAPFEKMYRKIKTNLRDI